MADELVQNVLGPVAAKCLRALGAGTMILHAAKASGAGDVDVATSSADPWWPLRLPGGTRLCQVVRHDVTANCFVVEVDGHRVAIDVLHDPDGLNADRFPARFAATDGQSLAPGWMHAGYLALKWLRKRISEPGAWTQIRTLAEEDPARVEDLLVAALGSNGRVLSRIALEGGPPGRGDWRRLRTAQFARRFISPKGLVLPLWMAARLIDRVLHPTGLCVVIVGPDGAGKSSLAEALPAACTGLFHQHVHIHWRPGLFPRPGAAAGSRTVDPTNPHGEPTHGPVLSLAILLYYWLDFLVGTLARILVPRVRTGLVVQERGWWDLAVDPRRYRLRVPPWLVRLLGVVLPKPDLLLLLDAPSETLESRKQELPYEELQRQRDTWRRIDVGHTKKVVVDASQPFHEVVQVAREVVVSHLERRATRRLAAGWAGLPRQADPRWWLPRGPGRLAMASLRVYQPVTLRGRIGWEVARLVARVGGLRVLPRAEAPPRGVRELLAPFLPPRSTYAVMRANHEGRYVALLLDGCGRYHAVAKVATTEAGQKQLRWEAAALQRYSPRLVPPLRAPRLLAVADGILLLEPIWFRPRTRPWWLPEEVAASLGRFFRESGAVHGDVAPWNLLRTSDGWILVDWEAARPTGEPFWDLFHFLIQAHSLLGSPSRPVLLRGLCGRGPVAGAIAAYAEAAGISVDEAPAGLARYLASSMSSLDSAAPDGARSLKARRAFISAMAAAFPDVVMASPERD